MQYFMSRKLIWLQFFAVLWVVSVFYPLPASGATRILPPFRDDDPLVPDWGNVVVTRYHQHVGGTKTVTGPFPITLSEYHVVDDRLYISWDYPLDNQSGTPRTDLLLYSAVGSQFTQPSDFSDTDVAFDAFVPHGIEAVFLELNDINNKKRGWLYLIPEIPEILEIPEIPEFPGGDLAPGTVLWQRFMVETFKDPVLEGQTPQSPFDFYLNEEGFDIEHVTAMSVGSVVAGGTSLALSDPIGGADAWTMFRPVPEPTSLALLTTAAIGVSFLRRLRR